MDTEGNWARIKRHRTRLSNPDMRKLAEVLFYEQEGWLAEKLRQSGDEALAYELLGYLGQSGSLEAVRVLLKQLEARDEAQQIAAAEAMKLCPPILVADALAQMMLREGPYAIKAGEVLLSYGQAGADALWQLWFGEDRSVGVRAQVLQLLTEAMDVRTEALAFLAFLSGEEDLVRVALKAAEKLQAKALWGNIAGCLQHPSWKIRGRAVRLLGQWEERRALRFLRDMGLDPDPWVEEERLKAIALLQ